MTVAAVMATSAQIAAFEARLDKYETATATALMANEKKLEEVRAMIEALLDQAYVMEDGRHVFRTEDGAKVYGEFGTEVGSDELDIDLIGPRTPTWEELSERKADANALMLERQKIIEFEARIDAGRDAIADGEIGEADLAPWTPNSWSPCPHPSAPMCRTCSPCQNSQTNSSPPQQH